MREIASRLEFLVNVGLDYLSLDRAAGYALGRRSAAHPPREPDRLRPDRRDVRARRALDRPAPARQRAADRRRSAPARPRATRSIVVEHDEEAIRAADHVVDMGPGAGEAGGMRGRRGPPQAIVGAAQSLTGRYLSGALRIEIPRSCATVRVKRASSCAARSGNNLKNVDVRRSRWAVRLRHRRIGLGQIDAGQRHAVRRGCAPPVRPRRPSPRRTSRSPGWSISTRSSTSTRARSAARRAPIPRPTRASSRRSASSSPACRKRASAATTPGASRSTSRAGAARPARATA